MNKLIKIILVLLLVDFGFYIYYYSNGQRFFTPDELKKEDLQNQRHGISSGSRFYHK